MNELERVRERTKERRRDNVVVSSVAVISLLTTTLAILLLAWWNDWPEKLIQLAFCFGVATIAWVAVTGWVWRRWVRSGTPRPRRHRRVG